jgi:type IV pilus assembly protein PilP
VTVNKTTLFRCIALSLLILLAGCSSNRHIRDLQQYVENLKKAAGAAPVSAPSPFQAPPPVVFQTNSGRSPFEGQGETVKVGNSAALSLHPLQGYALSALKFKGTVTQNNEMFAFILAPDDKLYQIKLGDIIGDHYGKIIHIYPDRLEVLEKVAAAPGQATTRTVTLQRKD